MEIWSRIGKAALGFLLASLVATMEAAAMNKAELIEAMASEASISPDDAGKVVEGFTTGVGEFLRKGFFVSVEDFGVFSTSARPIAGNRCGIEVEVDFKPDAALRSGENPLFEENQQVGENPLFVESVAGGGGDPTVFGNTDGVFAAGDEVVALSAGKGIVHRDIAARGGVFAVLGEDLDGDGRPDVLDAGKGEGDEVRGLRLWGIEKSDIRRGMVIAPVQSLGGGDCDDDDRDIRPDSALVDFIAQSSELSKEEVVEPGYESLVRVMRETILADEVVEIEGFGSFVKETDVTVSADVDSAPEEKERGKGKGARKGRNPQTGKEIKIAATGLTDQEERRLTALAVRLLREPGPGGAPQLRTGRKVKFKAGAELSGQVN